MKEPKPGAALQSTFLNRVHDPVIGDMESIVLDEPMSDGPSDEAEVGEQ